MHLDWSEYETSLDKYFFVKYFEPNWVLKHQQILSLKYLIKIITTGIEEDYTISKLIMEKIIANNIN